MTYKKISELAAAAALDLTELVELEQAGAGAKTTLAALRDAIYPPGIVDEFAGTVAPDGWLMCDGAEISRATYARLFAAISTVFGVGDGATTFNIPDRRGIFARGAGTSSKLLNANGVAFTAVLGTYQNDKMQGHKHLFELSNDTTGSGQAKNVAVGANAVQTAGLYGPSDDGVNGPPRTGTETNGANVAMNHIIKY